MSRTRYRIFEQAPPYFVTCTVVAWLPIFANPWAVEIVLGSWRFLQRERGVRLFGYVIMENHLHWIAAAQELPAQLGRFKSYTARRIIDELVGRGFSSLLDELRYHKLPHKADQEHQLWQEGSHPEQIQNTAMMRQKLEYMHNNPLRRAYVDDPVHWRCSSARNYAGLPGLIDVDTEWQ